MSKRRQKFSSTDLKVNVQRAPRYREAARIQRPHISQSDNAIQGIDRMLDRHSSAHRDTLCQKWGHLKTGTGQCRQMERTCQNRDKTAWQVEQRERARAICTVPGRTGQVIRTRGGGTGIPRADGSQEAAWSQPRELHVHCVSWFPFQIWYTWENVHQLEC